MSNFEQLQKSLGKRIQDTRKKQKISAEKAAYEIGMPKSLFRQIERGIQNPTLKTLHRISVGLGVNLSELFKY